MILQRAFTFLTLFTISIVALAQKPRVVVLGVGHSTQLINYNHQPAAIRAFIDRVKPAAICVERSPEEFSKNDFYEFTYEQQYLILPYAKNQKIAVHPIDWLPDEKDMDLAFGMQDLETPKFIRQKEGFLGFTTFNDASDFEDGLYFADDPGYVEKISSWYNTPAERTAFDFPRRLFLYRTFMQAKRIQKVLENYTSNDVVLVVIGSFHKNDIEKQLQDYGYEIVQPHTFGAVTEQEMQDHFTPEDAYAILSFNLLGMQNNLQKINTKLVDKAFEVLKDDQSAERQLMHIKYETYLQKMNSKEIIQAYTALLLVVKDERFTWTAVKDKSRLDSYIDPFGNLSLQQRIRLELAKEYRKLDREEDYQKQVSLVAEGLSDLKKAMLYSYLEKNW